MLFIATGNVVKAYCGATTADWTPASASQVSGLHHVAITHDGTNIKVWWDGVQKASAAAAAPSGTVGGQFMIGAYAAGGGAGQPCVVGDMAIYDAALDGTTLLAHAALVHGA